jgi:hypothetical protein
VWTKLDVCGVEATVRQYYQEGGGSTHPRLIASNAGKDGRRFRYQFLFLFFFFVYYNIWNYGQ